MPRFDYVCAHSVAEALQLLGDPGQVSRPLAGGTDVLVYVRQEKPPFDRLVDISRIPELKRIERRGDEVSVGAAVTFTEAAESALLREVAACLVEACLSVGGPAIRNTGTLGGNVANAAACADSLPAWACLDAAVHLRSLSGERRLPLDDFIQGANRTALQPGELLTHFTFPVPPAGVGAAFTKLGRRNAQAISRLSMAAMGRLDAQGRVDYVRLAPGAAMPRPQRFTEVEALLLGQTPTDELLTAAGAKTAEVMIGVTGRRWSTEYKEIAIQALAERTLRRALGQSKVSSC
ncbi:MAG: xanthine dehydrogenase family protein subunit M [Chloroflexi bacterium]|nr:xanthine dehydrogenase family protein subunit M [Chloroflexota bacterium]